MMDFSYIDKEKYPILYQLFVEINEFYEEIKNPSCDSSAVLKSIINKQSEIKN